MAVHHQHGVLYPVMQTGRILQVQILKLTICFAYHNNQICKKSCRRNLRSYCLFKSAYHYCPSADGPGSSDRYNNYCYSTDVPAFGSTTPASGGDNVITYTWQYTTNMGAIPAMQTGRISADRMQQPTILQILQLQPSL